MKVIGYYHVIVAALLALTLQAGPSFAADDRDQDSGPAISDLRANQTGADKTHSAEHTQDCNCQDAPAEEGECYECVLPPKYIFKTPKSSTSQTATYIRGNHCYSPE
ncbi:nodulation protein NolE [Rhizobium sp. C104]|uniref:nodulation protein NolE n=1 Tax=Rhizobium sp. C104 TaxID=2917727 RepID=UPI0023BA98F8|nr:nodulation protein NolE [Rhizobium sp. C104]